MKPIIRPSKDTCKQSEEDLAVAIRLLTAENARLAGAKGYTVDAFKQNMKEAIVRGSLHDK